MRTSLTINSSTGPDFAGDTTLVNDGRFAFAFRAMSRTIPACFTFLKLKELASIVRNVTIPDRWGNPVGCVASAEAKCSRKSSLPL